MGAFDHYPRTKSMDDERSVQPLFDSFLFANLSRRRLATLDMLAATCEHVSARSAVGLRRTAINPRTACFIPAPLAALQGV